MGDQRLTGRYILITGGGGGIGIALAKGLTNSGAKVFVADVRAEAALEVASAFPGTGWAGVDVRDQTGVERLVAKAVEHGGPIDGLVNAHGISNHVPFLEMPVEEWSRVIDVNLTGTFVVGQAVARHMVEHKTQGAIVNIASIMGRVGAPHRVHYLASKGGVNINTPE